MKTLLNNNQLTATLIEAPILPEACVSVDRLTEGQMRLCIPVEHQCAETTVLIKAWELCDVD